MKRILTSLFALAFAAVLFAPVSFSIGLAGQGAVAEAATPTPTPAAGAAATPAPTPLCPSPEVYIGVPLLNGNHCLANDSSTGGVIVEYVKEILQVVSAGVGAVIMLMLVIGGIQYITSLDDPGQVKAARDRIVNAITALILFVLAFAILTFVIPGGILS